MDENERIVLIEKNVQFDPAIEIERRCARYRYFGGECLLATCSRAAEPRTWPVSVGE